MHKKESKFQNAAKLNKYDEVLKIFEKIDKAKSKSKLKDNFDIDAKDSNGTTALHQAAKHGNIDMMVFLVARGADIESIDKIGWRPISYACANNHLNAVKTLIQWKSNVNKFSIMEENSPLHIASGFGYVDIVKLLMDHGANVHSQNKKKKTPMDIACENNHYKVVNALLSASSKVIEDTSKKSLTINNFAPINSFLSRSSFLIKTQPSPTSHINHRAKSENQPNGDFEYKRRTIGSQIQLCTPIPIPVPKKSGSLNTVFMNDELHEKDDEKEFKKGMENKLNNSEIEVSLPYPSKYSTSEKLKIKSPLLATKNWRIADRNRPNNTNASESPYVDQYSAQFIFPPETKIHNIEKQVKNIRPLSSSYKENLSTKSPVHCNSPSIIPFFTLNYYIPTQQKKDFECKINTQLQKSHCKNRGFGSESDIKGSKNNGNHELTKLVAANTPVINHHSYIRSPSLQEHIIQNTDNNTSNENKNETMEKYTCYQWIKGLGLRRIWDTLIKEGFDSFLALSLATDEELLILCDNNIDDLDRLKQNLQFLNLPSMKQLEFSTRVPEILFQLGLECYKKNFCSNGYLSVKDILQFEEMDLNKFQISKIGHRKLLLSCFNILRSKFSQRDFESKQNDEEKTLNNAFNSSTSECYESKILIKSNSHNNLVTHTEFVNHSNVVPRKPVPPPIPSRSSSIVEDSELKNLTLDDILFDSKSEQSENNLTKNSVTNKTVPDLSNLDDIVDLLKNLGKELDLELDNI